MYKVSASSAKNIVKTRRTLPLDVKAPQNLTHTSAPLEFRNGALQQPQQQQLQQHLHRYDDKAPMTSPTLVFKKSPMKMQKVHSHHHAHHNHNHNHHHHNHQYGGGSGNHHNQQQQSNPSPQQQHSMGAQNHQEMIKFVQASWAQVMQEYETSERQGSRKVSYYEPPLTSSSLSATDIIKPFELEEWFVKRMLQNMDIDPSITE